MPADRRDDMTAVGGYGSSMSGVGRTVMPLLFFIFSFLTNTTSSGASPAAFLAPSS